MERSKILGILSICFFWFPLAGLPLGVIGLSVQKESGKEKRDKILNIIGIILNVIVLLAWYLNWAYWEGYPPYG
jgi:fumarate reductase subunit C